MPSTTRRSDVGGPQDICADLRRSLEAAGAGPVAVRETHVSWVLLSGDRAFKLKKPVRFGFVDQSTPERRRACCEAEVAVNRPLAPDVVLGVRPLVEAAGGLRVGEEGDGPALDWVVVMRRFDERQTLASLLDRGRLPAGAIGRIARRIAEFHAQAAVAAPADWPDALAATWARNLDELQPLVPEDAAVALRCARRFGRMFVGRRREELARRAADGLVRDGHGDLRAEHVLLEDGDVTIVDRLEFDPALRRVDVADDLAFLLMDLESLGAREAARELVRAYRAAGGDAGDDALLAFFGAYRALVRAKVELLRARRRQPSRASGLLALAERLMWRARGPLVLAISGPPASGKSTLAAELARRSGLPVLSSDAIRKEQLGIRPTRRAPGSAYDPVARSAVYEELGRRAGGEGSADGVIVDATFGEPSLRQAFLTGAGAARGAPPGRRVPGPAGDLDLGARRHAAAAVAARRTPTRT